MGKQLALHWFRKNLRLHDNPALCEAIKGSHNFFGVYVLPPFIPDANISANRWFFLLECLKDLDCSLRKLGSQLLVVQGYAGQVIPQLLRKLNATKLTFEKETEPFGQQRDVVITRLAESAGVEVLSCGSHTLFDVDQVVRANHGDVPTFFDEFIDVVSTLESPNAPMETVSEGMFSTCLGDDDSFHGFHIPMLEELGIDPSQVTCAGTWQGGETAGLRKLENVIQEMVDNNFEVSSIQEEFLRSSCGALSPFLRFGCLSARLFYHTVAQKYLEVKGESPPLEIFQPLLWRDFLFTVGSQHPTLNKMEDNPLCLQIKWEANPSALEQWKMGKTGFPFIDAIMRQLRQEGWISEIARHIVGNFLTRGCLWISWEEGFKLFGELQLDAEWSPNAGSWMMFSGSAFFHKTSNIFCGVEDARKIDPSGDYIRKYLPEVKGLPTKYIFKPWTAPVSVQEAAGCVVGKDYPSPLVDHKKQRRVCVQRLKELAHNIEQSSSGEEKRHTSLHWFRKDLRLHDNPTLVACLQGSSTFYPVYLLDTAAARHSKVSANRWNFLLESLQDLDDQLKKLGSRLFVVRGRDVEVLPKLLSEWGISRLSYESDSEPHGAQRDAVVRHIAEKAGVEVLTKTSHTLYEPGQIVDASRGIVPMLFEDFVRVVEEKNLMPPPAVEKVDKILLGSCITPVAFDHQTKFGVPALSEVGVKDIRYVTSRELWRGGEEEALRRLGILEKELVKNEFGELPLSAGLLPSSPTHLSPYLRFGCLSPRMMFEKLTSTYEKVKDEVAPVSFYEPLLLREFFFLVASVTPGLQKMDNNPVCVQYPWEENAEGLERWKNGTTGFPWIDAVMRQLRLEGWIPHFAREAVGCFLTRGCLWINWEEGYKVFDELQLDAEWSLNAGNWLWLSCSTFVKGHVPWYCPVEVGKKADPTGEYIRKYVPELKHLPVEYLHEPWKAPVHVQKAARCKIGDDYPEPVADHIQQRVICVQRLKEMCISLDILGHNSIHWFRKDLRLHDNPALVSCLADSRTFYGVYFLEHGPNSRTPASNNRWKFLVQSLHDLDSSLARCGSRLFVMKGRPIDLFPSLFREWNITRLSFETHTEPRCKTRDFVIANIAKQAGVEVINCVSHTLYDVDELLLSNGGIAPRLFDEFEEVIINKGRPEMPAPTVNKKLFGACITPVRADHNQKYGIPKLEDLAARESNGKFSDLYRGGEQKALVKLEAALKEITKNEFCYPPISAAALMPSPTHLSPYLRLGCLSVRLLYQRITEEYIKKKGSSPSVDVYRKLLWREFFFTVASQTAALHEMANNPLCLEFPWEDNPEFLEKWKQGLTGFPWIDAIMRQLTLEGWIHDVARKAVGLFLTRGCLWINWQEGFKVFDELQLDAEWSLNAGNWLWLSGSTFVRDHVPWYCPVEVGKNVDPAGEYVRKYVPEVRQFPLTYLYEPWLAPRDVQEASKCVIGQDYPYPIVDHVVQRDVCVQRLKELAIKLSAPE